MKITIDTKQDHPSEIEHAIRLLSALLNKKGYSKNYGKGHNNSEDYNSYGTYGLNDSNNLNPNSRDIFNSDSEQTGGFVSMFGDESDSNSNTNEYPNNYETYGSSNTEEDEEQNFTIKPY